MTRTQIIAEPGIPQITTCREFDASREFIFRAYTDPELLVQWLGPRRLTMEIEEYDVRDGGKWRFLHRDAEGNAYGFHGVFHGMPSVNTIVRTFEFEGAPGHVSLETLTLEEHGGKTVVRSNAVFQSIQDRDGMIQNGMESGVEDSMARLDELIVEMLATN